MVSEWRCPLMLPWCMNALTIMHGSIIGGTGQDLATQIFDVLTIKLGLTPPELSYLRGRFSFNFTMSRHFQFHLRIIAKYGHMWTSLSYDQ